MTCRMKRAEMAVLTLVLMGASGAGVVAADPPAPATMPATRPAAGRRVIVTRVVGLVQVRTGRDQPWRKAEVGMELTDAAEVRVGPRGSLGVVIPAQETSIDRLGTTSIGDALDGKPQRLSESPNSTSLGVRGHTVRLRG